MELTVLGAYGPYPACGGGTSSYLVRGERGAIALDFGSGALGRLQRVIPLSHLQGVVLSHLHYDHICDLLPFSYYLKSAGKKIPLVYPQTDCVQRSIIEDSDGFERIPLCPQMNIGEFSLSFTKMTHPLESYAVRVRCDSRTLFYSGDTSLCPALEQAARGAHRLLLDWRAPFVACRGGRACRAVANSRNRHALEPRGGIQNRVTVYHGGAGIANVFRLRFYSRSSLGVTNSVL